MQDVAQAIEHYGVIVVFVSVLLDKAGLPVPSYPVLLVAGALSVSGGAPAVAIVLTAICAGLTADLLWYGAGVKFGRRTLAVLCKISLSPDSCVRHSETVLSRSGPWALLFVKFIPGLRYVSVVLAGINRVSLPVFLLLDGAGNSIYFGVAVTLGRLFHDALDAVLATLTRLGVYGLALIAGALGLYLTIRWIQRQNFIRQLRMDRISVEELIAMIDAGQEPVIVDVRPVDARREGMIPGAIACGISDATAALGHVPRDREIVVYCSCPNEATAAIAALHLKRAGFKRIRPLLGGIEAWAKAGRSVVIVHSPAANDAGEVLRTA